uniref:Uncharacterized protein n=1 Tax=Caenorhabditis japonica TaxID=281687 RepID=A0A8R1DJ34_CAEJA
MIAVLAARKTSEAYEYPQGEAEGEAESNYPGQMEKRKPSFVRFGKRSSSDYPLVLNQEELQMNKRKPSFVRFGRK